MPTEWQTLFDCEPTWRTDAMRGQLPMGSWTNAECSLEMIEAVNSYLWAQQQPVSDANAQTLFCQRTARNGSTTRVWCSKDEKEWDHCERYYYKRRHDGQGKWGKEHDEWWQLQYWQIIEPITNHNATLAPSISVKSGKSPRSSAVRLKPNSDGKVLHADQVTIFP